MLNSKEKSYAAAQKFQQKGQLDKAIAELERLLQEDPADLRTLLKIGDLHVRRQDTAAALACYIRVARTYQAQGFALKAVAVYKQVVHLAPGHIEAVTELAELYEKLGLISDSVAQFQQLLEHFKAHKSSAQAIDVVRKLMLLCGDTQDLTLTLAELHVQSGNVQEARHIFTQVAEDCLNKGRKGDWAQAAEQLLALDEELAGLACELAKHYMSEEQPKKALLKLQLAFRAAPQDTETLTLLAQVFEALGQVQKAIAVMHELGTQAEQRGQTLALERIAKHILKLNADDAQAQAWSAKANPLAQTAGRHQRVLPPLPKGSAVPAEAVPISKVDITNLLIEASVFARYQLYARADEYLQRVLAAFADHPEALLLQRKLQAQKEAAQSAAAAPRAPSSAAHPLAHDHHISPSASPGFEFSDPQPPHEDVLGPTTDTSAEIVAEEPGDDSVGLELVDMEALQDGFAQAKTESLDALIAEEVQLGQESSNQPSRLDEHIDQVLLEAAHQEAIEPSLHEVKNSEHETQFGLGIAYKEMGLFDDAYKQFAKLMHVAGYTVTARSMAALCLFESGAQKEGQKLLQEAVCLPEATASERAAIYYDLGSSYLASDDDAAAQAAFAQSAQLQPNFRDAALRAQNPHADGGKG